ncbi:MAG: hypothetical protein HY055_05375 [Magnetospirillum sp.]|nr:hypothetical protein [Magnetospirillum sp.]
MIMRRTGWIGVMAMASLLAGCSSGLPPAASVEPSPVPGVALPYKARVMIYMGETDLNRNLVIQISRYQTEETKVKDGQALANAARALLSKGFQQAEINDPALRPQIVVRLIGKTSWARLDTRFKIGCGIDAWTSDGVPLGNFTTRWESPVENDYASDLEAAYGQCLKKPLDDLLRSPGLAQQAGTGFKSGSAAAIDTWMRSLGPIPTRR